MADYFIDTGTSGTNAGTGANPWNSIKTGLEQATLTAQARIWISRRSTFTASSAGISMTADGTAAQPILAIACPRNTRAGTGDFLQANHCITNIAGVAVPLTTTPLQKYGGRYLHIDSDSGKKYCIHAILVKLSTTNASTLHPITHGISPYRIITGATSGAKGAIHKVSGTDIWVVMITTAIAFSNGETINEDGTSPGSAVLNASPVNDGFFVDRYYTGATGTGVAFTIEADDYYSEFQALNDTGWERNKAAWNADADDLPIIDLGNTTYNITNSGAYFWLWQGLNTKGYANGANQGAWYVRSCGGATWKNCIFEETYDSACIDFYQGTNQYYLEACIFYGSYTAGMTHQRSIWQNNSHVIAKDCSAYNFSTWAWEEDGNINGFLMKNCNIGYAAPSLNNDLFLSGQGECLLKEILCGGKGGQGPITTGMSQQPTNQKLRVENFNHIAGNDFTMWNQQIDTLVKKLAVVVGSGEPYAPPEGAGFVWKITSTQSSAVFYPTLKEWMFQVNPFVEAWRVTPGDTSSHTYKIFFQAKDRATVANTELFLEADYCDQYINDNTYHMSTIRSTETIAQRSDASDWSQFLSVTLAHMNPTIPVVFRLYCTIPYDIDGCVYMGWRIWSV
jgi:hypothetical protein